MKDFDRAFDMVRTWVLSPDTTLPDPSYEIRTSCGVQAADLRPMLAEHHWAQEQELTEVAEFSVWRVRRLLDGGMGRYLPDATLGLVLRQLFTATDYGIQTQYGTRMKTLETVLSNSDRAFTGDLYAEWLIRTNPYPLTMLTEALTKNAHVLKYRAWYDRNVITVQRAAEIRIEFFHKHLALLLPDTEYASVKDLHPGILKEMYRYIWDNGFDLYRRHMSVLRPITFRHYDSAGAWRYPFAFGAGPKTLQGIPS